MIQQQEVGDVLALHAAAPGGELIIWAESARALLRGKADGDAIHPFCVPPATLRAALADLGVPADAFDDGPSEAEATLLLPTRGAVPTPSAALALSMGREPADFGVAVGLAETRVTGIRPMPAAWGSVLETVLEACSTGDAAGLVCSPSVGYFAALARFAAHLLAQQRFVPMLYQDASGKLSAAWHPWLSDDATASRVALFVKRMPVSARCAVDELDHDPWRVVDAFISRLVDSVTRAALNAQDMAGVVEDLDPAADVQVAWASALLTERVEVAAAPAGRSEIARRVRRWIGTLEDRGKGGAWRLLLRLNEPLIEDDAPPGPRDALAAAEAMEWSISFHLQSIDLPDVVLDAADVWAVSRDTLTIQGVTLDAPQELLLAELGRASRLYKKLESALDASEPVDMMLTTATAYEFLREYRPLLVEQGFAVESPPWWNSPAGRLGARLKIDSDPVEAMMDLGGASAAGTGPQLGLSALVGYHWEIAIGDTTLTLHEFEKLAAKGTPLVRLNGRWVEIRPEDVQSAVRFISANPGGEMKLGEAMRLAYASDPRETGLPVLGMEATGWVATLFGEQTAPGDTGGRANLGMVNAEVPHAETPESFHGTLRPYQVRGLSWLMFLEKIGFGACLADDMGLGKTVQLLALLAQERDDAGADPVAPTLLVAPMSVIGNWLREARRFTPSLKVLVHHGADRLVGDALVAGCLAHDLVITTYALAHRDHETLVTVPWGRMVLDEAQFIKNPAAKQSLAVRSIAASRRIALTGTPVENRLSELWSIMDFLNPGYLGAAGTFRKKFSVPIERYRDVHRGRQLRGLVRPFILRRVKSDPTVVADLPDKLETKEYTHLTTEQAQLYESCVKRMLSEVEATEGIHRRGVVLAALIRLKQICNHPAQILRDHDPLSGVTPDPSRSGKCIRLMEMVEQVLAEGERALVFTQFRQMGHLLAAMLRHAVGSDVLFLHGGTSKTAREQMVDQFQDPKSGKPILLLSLKAGGVGLNLTAATHVFHFDRWWNPAVENQATDRAYRIGQTRTVHVHKFVVRGTLEERIDEMIESKTELAENIIGQGERWLTELDVDQLKDILTLRADAIGDEE